MFNVSGQSWRSSCQTAELAAGKLLLIIHSEPGGSGLVCLVLSSWENFIWTDCMFLIIARELGLIITATSSSSPLLVNVLLWVREKNCVSAHWVGEMLMYVQRVQSVHFSLVHFDWMSAMCRLNGCTFSVVLFRVHDIKYVVCDSYLVHHNEAMNTQLAVDKICYEFWLSMCWLIYMYSLESWSFFGFL